MKRVFFPLFAIALLIFSMCVVATADTAAAQIGTQYYNSLSDALASYPGGDAVIKLLSDVTEPFALTSDTKVDLAGHSITGEISQTAGTLYLMDSNTDDYTVEDGNGYGTVVTASYIQPISGYIPVSVDGRTSFHRVQMELTNAYLRPSVSGIYFSGDFAGDEVVKENILYYGIAFTIGDKEITEASVAADTEFKTRTAFTKDTWICGNDSNCVTGSIVENILQTDNGNKINLQNASIKLAGVPYIQLSNNQVFFGARGSKCLKDALTDISTEANWSGLTETQKTGVVNMYKEYRSVMRNWDIPVIKDAYTSEYGKGTLKILTIGNSFSLDSTRILYEIAKQEGTTDLVLGVLYHSGCSLQMHVDYLTNNSKSYNYYKNSTGEWISTGGTESATMLQGIQDEDWDIIVLQQASFSSGRPNTYNADLQTIMDYVKANCPNANPTFAWNMTWAYPVEDIDTDDKETINTTTAFKTYYNNNQMTMYNAICDAVKTKIATDPVYEYIFPVGTAIQNARSSYLGDPQLNRDYSHLSDYGRVIAAYTWYYALTEKNITEIALDKVPKALRVDKNATGDLVLTQNDKALILESVKNAIDDPFQLTQSAYTTAP